MTTKRIIYTRSDGSVSVVGPAPEFVANFDGTEAEAIAFIQAKDVPADAVDVEIVEQATIPTDRWFRDAWTRPVGGGSINIDMPRAREIQAERIQVARQRAIRYFQDEEDMARLTGRAPKADQHAADRASLEAMNLTAVATRVAGAANPTALKAIWPVKLPVQE
ncbi:hypothetical protein LCGC14_2057750 [marine sediment metagenome]|uniref:Tail fiber assembly protein n=1 Tax=marine sediment metagenome TaxID=412755 RepID=A0A0F9F9G6_9ZZZZ